MKEIVERLRFLASGQDDPQSVALDEAANEIERQFNQIAALIDLAHMLRKDATRYQWLRSMARSDMYDKGVDLNWYEAEPEALDAAIDAAMKVSGG